MATSAVPVPDSPEPDPETRLATQPDDERPELDEDELDGAGGRMSFLDHLDELRRRLITSVSAIFIAFVGAYFFHEELTAFIMVPLNAILPEVEGGLGKPLHLHRSSLHPVSGGVAVPGQLRDRKRSSCRSRSPPSSG